MLKSNGERPTREDIGKPAWVWQLPGSHPSQIRSGVLIGPDPTAATTDPDDLALRISGSVHLFPWATIVWWGIGSPPTRDTVRGLRENAKSAHVEARALEKQGAMQRAAKEHARADSMAVEANELEQRLGP